VDFRHATIMRDEVARLLSPSEGKQVLDGTLGGGGHTEALLERGAAVIGLDRDPVALEAAGRRLERFGSRLRIVQAEFGRAREVLDTLGVARLDGALLDLGVSSPQLDEPTRGFSFSKPGPLDMRMGNTGETAAELLERLDEEELARVLREYGEEPAARRIARAIKNASPRPTTTTELAELVGRAIPRKAWPKSIHPATRTFQALRIAVNRELDELDRFLEAIPSLLAVGGRAAIISFHSLEDRRVKRAFRALAGECTCPPGMPVCGCGERKDYALLAKGGLVPSEEEIAQNPRARSARLRAVERLA